MKDSAIIKVRDLSKKYYIGKNVYSSAKQGVLGTLSLPFRMLTGVRTAVTDRNQKFIWALKNINFDVYSGDRIGVIGSNGAGKSTLLKIISKLVYPTEGEVRIRGRVTSLFEMGTGFNANLTGRENIFLNGSLHGLSRPEINDKFKAIVEFSGIGKFIDTPAKYYSSGMYMRLAFSIAAHLDPDILLLGEVLAVGDMLFQQKCLKRIEGLTSEGRTILFVSHSMGSITRFCDRCIWLENGQIKASGPSKDVTSEYASAVLNVTSKQDFLENKKDTKKGIALKTEKRSSQKDEREQKLYARLVAARVVNKEKTTVTVIPIDSGVGVEFTYDILESDILLVPAISLVDSIGNVVFWAVDVESKHLEKLRTCGRHASTVWIPSNFLNEGQYSISIAVVNPNSSPMERHIFAENALSFYSAEAENDEGAARGIMPRRFPGPIRPLLDWDHRNEE